MLVSLAPLFAGRGWGEGLLPQIPKINVRGESPSPGWPRAMLRIARSNPTSPRKRGEVEVSLMRPRQTERYHLLQRALHWGCRKQRQRIDRHGAVMLGTVDGVFQRAMFCHQANGVVEIAVADFAAFQRIDPEGALGGVAAAERQHHRQRDLALAEIVADVLAELCGLAAIVQHVVDELEGDTEIHADRTAR